MIVNLTPNTVNIITNDMEMAIKSSGVVRCSQKNTPICTIDGIPITATTYGEVEGLPDYEDGIYYIVSRLVMDSCPNRKDLLAPNELIRDAEGKIVGCKSLSV